jgi:hypothetical protein
MTHWYFTGQATTCSGRFKRLSEVSKTEKLVSSFSWLPWLRTMVCAGEVRQMKKNDFPDKVLTSRDLL